ncbi:MAG: hypothetical protein IPP40_16185 [bacterium]|nr:hypothetical protein [bacterium]
MAAHGFQQYLDTYWRTPKLPYRSKTENPVLREDLRKVMQAALRAKELVKQILTFSRQTEVERFPLYSLGQLSKRP